MMVDLDGMALFVAVVDAGSLSAAARQLGLPKSTVSRRLTQLESALKTPLLHRSTRSLALTDHGRAYADRARPLVREAAAIEDELLARTSRPSGLVRISATTGFGQIVLGPVLCSFMHIEPDVRFELILTDARVNLLQQNIDIAIRMGALDDADLLSRKIANVTRLLCASPGYLATRGNPEAPADLAAHDCIVTAATLDRWTFADGTEVRVHWRLSAGNIALARDAALGGHGIALLPRFLIAEDLAVGKLVQVLPDHPLPKAEATALYPRDRVPSIATKVLLGHLVEELSGKDL
jgi:DNA-binding transcriptional LysR family regulator